MKKTGIYKTLSLVLAFAFVMSCFIKPDTVKAENAGETTILSEGFDHGVSAPEGWIFTGIDNVYTSTGSYGAVSPALEFDAAGDSITTRIFSNPAQLTFWLKGMSPQSESASLFISVCRDGKWQPLDYISSITTEGSTKAYALNSSVTQIKFIQVGSQGKFALDDVLVTGRISDGNPPTDISKISYIRTDSDNNRVPDFIEKGFTVEGRVTAVLGEIHDIPYQESYGPADSNSDGTVASYLRFYNTIYIQDETGGIALTGFFTKDLAIGMTIRASGKLYQSEGEARLAVENENTCVSIVDSSIKPVEPKAAKTGDSMLETNEGWLVKVTGKVTQIIQNGLYVDDGSGQARILVDSFRIENINYSTSLVPTLYTPEVKSGDTVTVTGIVSEDSTGHKIKIRNTSEIIKCTDNDTQENDKYISAARLNKSNVVINMGKSVYINIVTIPGNAVVGGIAKTKYSTVTIYQDKKNKRLLRIAATKTGREVVKITVTVNGHTYTLPLTVNVQSASAKKGNGRK